MNGKLLAVNIVLNRYQCNLYSRKPLIRIEDVSILSLAFGGRFFSYIFEIYTCLCSYIYNIYDYTYGFLIMGAMNEAKRQKEVRRIGK